MIEPLNHENFILYCARHYNNEHCLDISEFHDDIKRIRYIKKLLTRYAISGDIKERLILNHLIILSNLFSPEHLCRILYLKLNKQFHMLKPFLILLEILPPKIYLNELIDFDIIGMDNNIVELLRKV